MQWRPKGRFLRFNALRNCRVHCRVGMMLEYGKCTRTVTVGANVTFDTRCGFVLFDSFAVEGYPRGTPPVCKLGVSNRLVIQVCTNVGFIIM